jgi:hypothetical protein
MGVVARLARAAVPSVLAQVARRLGTAEQVPGQLGERLLAQSAGQLEFHLTDLPAARWDNLVKGAQAKGYRTVAVFSEADAGARHTRLA